MSIVLRVGAVARVDSEPERELAIWRDDLARGEIDDPSETRARLDQQARGEWILVELELFADLAEGNSLWRERGSRVRGCWFSPTRRDQNIQHARELVGENLELLQRDLEESGKAATLESLEGAAVEVVVGEDLAALLEQAASPGA